MKKAPSFSFKHPNQPRFNHIAQEVDRIDTQLAVLKESHQTERQHYEKRKSQRDHLWLQLSRETNPQRVADLEAQIDSFPMPEALRLEQYHLQWAMLEIQRSECEKLTTRLLIWQAQAYLN